jgi:hypothetical protein
VKPLISAVVAMARDGVIGRDNARPWHLPDDLKRFKSSGKCHGIALSRPMTPSRAIATTAEMSGFTAPPPSSE